MAGRIARSRKEQTRQRLAEAAQPKVIAVRARLLVHRAREDGPGDPCPCCGSRFAEIVRERPIDTLLIAPREGFRLLRSQALDTFEFDAYADRAHQVDLTLRCADWTDQEAGMSEEQILFDRSTKVWVMGGANRSGKTQLAITWLALRWFLRGGDETLFRIYAPLIKQAHIGMRKLIKGDANTHPLIPKALVKSYPATIRSDDQTIHLIDGSKFELMHARSSAHIKGDAVWDSVWIETTECPADDVAPVVIARHTTTGGQLMFDSTPKRGHWMIEYVEQAKKDREEERKAEADGREFEVLTRAIQKPIEGNPWNDPEEIRKLRAAIEAVDPIMARREFGGEWVGRYAMMFDEAWDGSANTVDMWEPDLSHLGLIDVTKQASRKFWGGSGYNWVIGVDVNVNPHTALMCKIFEHPAHRGESQRGILVYDELRVWNADVYQAAHALSIYPKEEPGAYCPAAIAIDANAAHRHNHPSQTGGRPFTPKQDYERFGFDVRTNKSPKGKPFNPDVRDSSALLRHLMRSWVGPSDKPVRRLLVNAAKAPKTIKAIESQQDAGDGRPIKINNTASDREIAAFTDSLRYLVWPLFNRAVYGREIKVY